MFVKNGLKCSSLLLFFVTFLGLIAVLCLPSISLAQSVATPWTSNMGFQNLVYGATTPAELPKIIGSMPDQIFKEEQISPLIEYDFYYADGGSGAATVFVFQNNLLAGLFYRSSNNQFIDLTYFIPNNGDMAINSQVMGNMQWYYPNFGLYTW